MDAIEAIWTNGQIVPAEPVDWPEGARLRVEKVAPSEKIGLDESEWVDSPEALADWETWLPTIEPPEFSDREREEFEQFDEEFRRFNVEAVRKQMQSEPDA